MTRAVLTFHSIDDSGSVLSFPILAFSRLIEQLAARGIAVVPFRELLNCSTGVTITFDDGMRTVHQHALPVLRDHGFPAHIFLTTGTVGKDIGWPSEPRRYDTLNWRELEECAAANLKVECHTTSHPDLRTLAPIAMLEECSAADDAIERHVGQRPTLLAFPYGHFDDTVIRTLAPRYLACFTTHLDYFRQSNALSQVARLDSYYLQAPIFRDRLLSTSTRAYIALRRAIRTVRGRA